MLKHRPLHAALLAAAVGLGFAPGRAVAATSPVVATTPHLDGVLNVNTATAEQWDLLPGIGPATAAKIVAYRTRRPFRSVKHLMRVKGIGNKTLARIRPFLTLHGETTLHQR